MADKRCTKCGEVKSFASFNDYKSRRTGKTYPQSWCKSCHVAYTREWQRKNTERMREYQRRFRQTESGKASNRASNKRFREKEGSAEKIRKNRKRWEQTERGQASLRRSKQKWRDENPDRIFEWLARNAIFAGTVSLDAPFGSKGTLLDCIADDKAVNPLESLIQKEAVVEITKRLVREKGFTLEAAIAVVEAHS